MTARRSSRASTSRSPPGEVVALLGPSGAGKSSLLRVDRRAAGRRIGATSAGTAPTSPGCRPTADGSGWCSRTRCCSRTSTSAGNVAYGLTAGAGQRDGAGSRSSWRWWTWPGTPLGRSSTLSGGEAQRVALARALAPAPRLLLLDEPFGALDRELRDRLAVDVRDLLHRLGTPAVHVTHDLTEAELVADRVVRLVPSPLGTGRTLAELTPRWFDPPEGPRTLGSRVARRSGRARVPVCPAVSGS